MRQPFILLFPLVTAGLVLAACGIPEGSGTSPGTPGASGHPASTSPSGAAQPSPSPSSATSPSPSTTPTTDPALAPLVAAVRRDLATRLGLAEGAIELVSSAIVTWGDGSLGCPQPGMANTQVPVDGALIVLAAAGMEYRYHSGGSRPPFLCDN